MTKTTTRRFFWGGTVLFTAVFIGLTIHTHTTIGERTNADALTPEVVAGLSVWERYNCENCHTLMGEGAYYAPDLTKIVGQRGRPYLQLFLADPSVFYSAERDGRLMPTLGLSERQCRGWAGGSVLQHQHRTTLVFFSEQFNQLRARTRKVEIPHLQMLFQRWIKFQRADRLRAAGTEIRPFAVVHEVGFQQIESVAVHNNDDGKSRRFNGFNFAQLSRAHFREIALRSRQVDLSTTSRF